MPAAMLLKFLAVCTSTIALTQAGTPEVITQSVIDAFLKAHNDARANVSVPTLVWDQALSDSASKWSSGCQFQHSDGDYGENIYASSPKHDNALAAQNAVKKWLAEIVYIDPPAWGCVTASSNTCGHYSQVVWRDTQRVGCGITHCQSPTYLANFVVCEYDPPGNYIGETPY